jgi:ABC-type glycerol-3-phosphate transport system substrate-binding protein
MNALGFNNSNLRTFDDFYRMSQRAVRVDAAGALQRIGYWPGIDSWETIGTLMCAPGHGLFDAANRPTATDPCNLAYLEYLKKLADLYGGYAKLHTFLAGDPDFLGGDRRAYMVNGKALITPSGYAFWNTPAFDSFSFGRRDGVSYQLTPLPPTVDGTMAGAANYPSTMQEVIIPTGARHPDVAFAVSKVMFWDHGYLLGRSTSGSPVVQDQGKWLATVIATEAAVRKQAGLPGNPIAGLAGLRLQPQLGLLSRASSPLNPVAVQYHQQLLAATERVLLGQQAPDAALAQVQAEVVAQQQMLKAHYGAWNW